MEIVGCVQIWGGDRCKYTYICNIINCIKYMMSAIIVGTVAMYGPLTYSIDLYLYPQVHVVPPSKLL